MKNILILLFSLLTICGYAQTQIDPSQAPTTGRVNAAIKGSITANGTNTYTATVTGFTWNSGEAQDITFVNANTGSSTFNLNGAGALTLKKESSGSLVDLVSGDIIAGARKRFYHNGTYLVMQSGGGGGTVTSVSGTANQIASTGGTTPVLSIVTNPILPGAPTIAAPGNSSQNIITTDATQTLSNKTFVAPALGTPASGVATNLTGTAAGLTAGNVTTIPSLSGDVANSGNSVTVTKINGTSLAGLGTGLLKNTTGTGVPSIAVSGTDIKTINGSSILGSGNIALGVGVFVTPEDYGAVGDGTTNDQAAIQSAVSSGKPVLFAQKNYRVNSTVIIPSDAYLFGYGTTSIISTTSNISVFTIQGKNILIRDIKILGNSTGAAQRGIDITGNAGFTLDYTQNRLENVYFEALLHAGLYVERVGTPSSSIHYGAVTAIDCFANACGTGFYLGVRAEYNNLISCIAYACTVQGYLVCGGNNNWVGGQIVDCLVGVNVERLSGEGNDAHGIVVGAKINHNTTAVKSVSIVNGHIFSNNFLYNNGTINLVGSTGIKFINNTFGGTTALTVNNCPSTEFLYNSFTTTPTATLTTTTPVWVGNTFTLGAVQPSFVKTTTPGIQRSSVATQFDVTSSTTLANVTGLTTLTNLVAGMRYSFEAVLYTSSNVAGGVKFAIGGTATATAITYDAITFDNATIAAQSRATSLATSVGASTTVTAALTRITGAITVNAAGTLTVQFAQNASNGTASSVLVGSTFEIKELL